ncbi:MAG: hypothetical protein HQK60_13875 [Deltaproteobacteria bacterium]|nr:hypothetical protein [Deltaproteobacteria bacterium]
MDSSKTPCAKCPECLWGVEIVVQSDFAIPIYCDLCGAKLIHECPICAKAIWNPQAKFCRFCGTRYHRPEPTAEADGPAAGREDVTDNG